MSVAGLIRAQVNVAKRENWIDQLTGSSPVAARGFPIDIEVGFFTDTKSNATLNPMDFSGFTSVTAEIHDNQYKTRAAVASAQATDFNIDLTAADWIAQLACHCKFSFSGGDMFLDLGPNQDQRVFWIFFYGIDGNGVPRPLGGTVLSVYETGAADLNPGPNQGGNIIPPASVYDGSGNLVIATTLDRVYDWTKGANDLTVINGGSTYSASQQFAANGSSITLTGTPGAQVTAILRYPLYFTADQVTAILKTKVSQVRAPGVYDVYISKSSTWKRTVGIDDAGNKIDQAEQL